MTTERTPSKAGKRPPVPRASGAPRNRTGVRRAKARQTRECRPCNGSGVVASFPVRPCEACDGLGEL